MSDILDIIYRHIVCNKRRYNKGLMIMKKRKVFRNYF